MKNINIAISINFNDSSNIWNNGLIQNIAFLARTLQFIPEIGKIYLVIPEGAKKILPPGLSHKWLDFPLVTPNEITHSIECIIEIGFSLPIEWVRHVKALGAKIIAFLVGHPYPGQAEATIFDQKGGLVFTGTPWDEAWLHEQHMVTSSSLLRTLIRAPVVAVPHLWSPVFIQNSADSLMQQGKQFGFIPDESVVKRPWRVGIFEPNISVAKTSFIPMLVCEAAYRGHRDSLAHMMVMCAEHMKEHTTFNRFASSLDLTKDHKATYEPRLPFVDCMTSYKLDAVVAHQWQNAQNYAYYDTLFGGYPLIHNSSILDQHGIGFYYPDFSAIIGGEKFIEAWRKPVEFWNEYKKNNINFLNKLHPENPENILSFRNRISNIFGD